MIFDYLAKTMIIRPGDFRRKESVIALLLLSPAVFLLILFVYYPALNTLPLSFFEYNLKMPLRKKFVGLNNYVKIFVLDKDFARSFTNTIIFMAVTISLSMLVGLFFAIILNEKFPGRGLVRSIVLLPWVIPPVVNGYMWQWILDGQWGALNGLLYQLGLIKDYIVWLANPTYSILWCAFVQAWRDAPFITVILLAALQSIPIELIEASKVDGADAMRRFMYIVLPLLKPSLTIAFVIELINSFMAFDIIYALTGVDPATRTLMMYNYQVAFQFLEFGYGAALSYVLFAIGLIFAYLYIKVIYGGGR
ncbi:MAG: sugar ABC transporter permease [Thermoprotei archaeon]|nr:MAG: sugar ABC transporter permease [Thermoprotei archaeon]